MRPCVPDRLHQPPLPTVTDLPARSAIESSWSAFAVGDLAVHRTRLAGTRPRRYHCPIAPTGRSPWAAIAFGHWTASRHWPAPTPDPGFDPRRRRTQPTHRSVFWLHQLPVGPVVGGDRSQRWRLFRQRLAVLPRHWLPALTGSAVQLCQSTGEPIAHSTYRCWSAGTGPLADHPRPATFGSGGRWPRSDWNLALMPGHSATLDRS